MRLIERYLFRQMLGPTFWALGALAALGLLSESLSGLDIIVDQRQSAWIFLKITLLGMPQVVSILAPIAVFVAAFMTFNRLQTEQEMVVCYAGGMSRWSVIAPAMRLAVLLALVSLAVNLWVQPWSSRAMHDEIYAVRADLAASMVREGEFTHPAPGLTVYAQEVGRQGQIKNLFIHQERPDGDLTYTAREGRIERQGDEPILLLVDASTQTFSKKGVLEYLTYESFPLRLSDYIEKPGPRRPKPRDRYMRELFFPDLSLPGEREMIPKLQAEAHSRLAAPLYVIAAMAMAIAAVLGGGFSRLGYGKRIGAMAAAAAGVRILGFVVQAGSEDIAAVNILQYAVPLGATAWALQTIFRAEKAKPRRRDLRRAAVGSA